MYREACRGGKILSRCMNVLSLKKYKWRLRLDCIKCIDTALLPRRHDVHVNLWQCSSFAYCSFAEFLQTIVFKVTLTRYITAVYGIRVTVESTKCTTRYALSGYCIVESASQKRSLLSIWPPTIAFRMHELRAPARQMPVTTVIS